MRTEMSTGDEPDKNTGFTISTGNTSSCWMPEYDYWYTPPTRTVNMTWTTAEPRCAYCDGIGHTKKPEICPRVKSINYFKDGSISKIEFHRMEE